MQSHQPLKIYLLTLCRKYKLYLSCVLIIAVSAAFFSVFVEYQIKEIIDAIALNKEDNITTLILLFMFFKFMHHGVFFIERLFGIQYKPALLVDIVETAYKQTMLHSLHWFDSHMSGNISSKIIDLQDGIITIINTLCRSVSIIVAIIVSAVFLFQVHYLVCIVLLLFIAIYIPVLAILLKKQIQLQETYTTTRQEAVGVINDSISNIFGIKVIGSIVSELKYKLMPVLMHWKLWDMKVRKFDAYYVDNADTIIVTIMTAAQIWLLSHLYQNNQITPGGFAFVAMITLRIHDYLDGLLENILFQISPKFAAIRSSYHFIHSPLDVIDSENASAIPAVNGSLKFQDIIFSYGNGPNIFDNFSLDIKAGEKVGVVGISGAGKTTLIKCLLRYFDTKGGNILIDNYNIRDITQDSLRANISVIPQDIIMFHRSILENLQLAKPDATLEEIQQACQKARIHNDIEQMAEGYQSIVGERGVKLSGGQRQRIAIARAILKNAPILILDEATSALDTNTEILIQQSINEMLETKQATTIAIAHRLSTLFHMDRIIVLQNGQIIEEGPHNELIKTNGLYNTLWRAQTGGFLGNEISV